MNEAETTTREDLADLVVPAPESVGRALPTANVEMEHTSAPRIARETEFADDRARLIIVEARLAESERQGEEFRTALGRSDAVVLALRKMLAESERERSVRGARLSRTEQELDRVRLELVHLRSKSAQDEARLAEAAVRFEQQQGELTEAEAGRRSCEAALRRTEASIETLRAAAARSTISEQRAAVARASAQAVAEIGRLRNSLDETLKRAIDAERRLAEALGLRQKLAQLDDELAAARHVGRSLAAALRTDFAAVITVEGGGNRFRQRISRLLGMARSQ